MAKLDSGLDGRAALSVDLVCGQSAVTSALARSPLKLLTPRARGRSVWACTSSYGGGLVGGDHTRLDLRLGPETRCYLGTQASTKIYRNSPACPCSHATRARLAEDSLLVLAPDPVQAFAGSRYAQRQEFQLAAGAALVLLDWFTAGRAARGERWQFRRFESFNEVWVQGERVFQDAVCLDCADGPLDSPMRMGRFNCFATLLVTGPRLETVAQQLLQNIARLPVERKSPLVAAASPVAGGAVLRLAGEEVEAVGRAVHEHLGFLTDCLGDDPWQRKW